MAAYCRKLDFLGVTPKPSSLLSLADQIALHQRTASGVVRSIGARWMRPPGSPEEAVWRITPAELAALRC
jgi:hypothetical protein